MNQELKWAVALVFRHKGSEQMSESKFVLTASMDLNWFSPKDAQRLLDSALEHKLLNKLDGSLTPAFDAKELDIPMDFKPDTDILDMRRPAAVNADDPIMNLVAWIMDGSGLEKKDVIARANEKQERLNVEMEVALLMLANELELPLGDRVSTAEKRLRARSA